MSVSDNLVDLINLHIPATTETPEVICSTSSGDISMIGNLILSDPQSFFAPILRWFKTYTAEYSPAKITVNFYLTFVNCCSEHYLGMLLKQLEDLFANGLEVAVICHYESDDTDMRDWARELNAVIKLPIEIVEIN
ncbi:MAG: DUF1987 family protein [Bacteroidales bacterium]|nr:DUF1987 family protein [Bacteroidales bacterium]